MSEDRDALLAARREAMEGTPRRAPGRLLGGVALAALLAGVGALLLALGAEVKIPTLGGSPVTLRVPAGTPNGRTFRVRGKGATKADGSKGDLLATVEVQVPAVLDVDARAAVEAYRIATADKPLRSNLFDQAQS